MNKLSSLALTLCLAASSELALARDSMSMEKDAMGKTSMSKDSMKKAATSGKPMSKDTMGKQEAMHKNREDSMKMKVRMDDKGR